MWEESNISAFHTGRVFGRVRMFLAKIVEGATPKDSTASDSDLTITDAGSGQYNIVFPKGEIGWCFAQFADATTSGSNVKTIVEAFSATAGTVSIQLDSGSALGSGDHIFVMILVARRG